MTSQADKAPLILAVPSKGRLQENANAFFARAGLVFRQSRGERDYRGTIAGFDNVEVLYLSASEIARELAQGGAHLGITGEDLIRDVYGVTPAEWKGLPNTYGWLPTDPTIRVAWTVLQAPGTITLLPPTSPVPAPPSQPTEQCGAMAALI